MKVYEVQNYYSQWYQDKVFSSRKKAEAYVAKRKRAAKKGPQPGYVCFQIVVVEVL